MLKTKTIRPTSRYLKQNKNNAVNYKSLCTRFVAFYSLIHRTRPPQIQAPQGFSPGNTSSASQARHLSLGGRLQCVQNREIEGLSLLKSAYLAIAYTKSLPVIWGAQARDAGSIPVRGPPL